MAILTTVRSGSSNPASSAGAIGTRGRPRHRLVAGWPAGRDAETEKFAELT